MHNTQQLRLMQLASSALPVGSFTWSQGLEWAVEIGWVKSVDDFSDWQIQQMEQNFFTVDLPLLARVAHSLHRQPTLRHGLAGRALENSPDRTGVKSRLQLD